MYTHTLYTYIIVSTAYINIIVRIIRIMINNNNTYIDDICIDGVLRGVQHPRDAEVPQLDLRSIVYINVYQHIYIYIYIYIHTYIHTCILYVCISIV